MMTLKRVSWIMIFLLIITISLVGCGGGKGGGGGGNGPTTGSVSGTVAFDSPEPLSKMPSINAPYVDTNNYSNYSSAAVPNEKIVKFKDNLTLTEITSIVQGMGGKLKHKIYGTKNTYVISIDTTRAFATNVNNNPGIISIENNLKFYACTITPNDPYYNPDQVWNYSMLFLPEAWDKQTGSNTVTVAVIDTGISKNHPDLIGNLVDGWDFANIDTDPDGDDDPSDTTYHNEANRWSHGTHVAGIISACTNNSEGVAGVCWNVKIMPIRVLGSDGSGTGDAIIAGINYAVAQGVKIINLSLASPDPIPYDQIATELPTYKKAIDDAVSQGVTIIAAAGNDNGAVRFPASYYDKVIAVSALGPNGTKASYSNYGPEIFVCAPGGDYNGTVIGSTILSTSGTLRFSTFSRSAARRPSGTGNWLDHVMIKPQLMEQPLLNTGQLMKQCLF